MVADTASEIDTLEPWHGFDQSDQAVGALGLVAHLLPQVGDDAYLWKWVIVGLHDALQGFVGLALRRTDGAQLLTSKHEEETYERWRREREAGAPVLEVGKRSVDSFLNLFEKIQNPDRMRQYVHSRAFTPTPAQDDGVRILDRLRNDFTHYSDTTRVVLVAELPRVAVDCLSVIDWLLNESNNVTLHPAELKDIANGLID